MVPTEEAEIPVFLLIFLFQKMWKTEDYKLSEAKRREEDGGGRKTYQ